jgi:segregation and condensation protein A
VPYERPRRPFPLSLQGKLRMVEQATFRIELPIFEGPLDLLLHLIRKHELDIMDLPVAFVTERYLDYLALMRELDLDVASEYLLMAATLAHIKSKMLLPTPPSDQDEDQSEQEDPRAELIRRLLEYQKYKEASENLAGRPIMGRDVFLRGAAVPENEGPAPLAEIGIFKLVDAFEAVLKRLEGRMAFEVTTERITIGARISQLTEMLRDKRLCRFEELFDGAMSRYDLVVTFLATLEMVKGRIARVYQADYGSTIYVQYALLEAETPTIPPGPDGDGLQESNAEDEKDR